MTGWDRLTLVAAPAALALSVDAAKAHLKIESGHEDADVIEPLIRAAIARVDGPRGIGVCLVTQTWRLTLDRFERFIRIPLGPNVAVVSVKYDDGNGDEQTLAEGTDFVLLAGQDPACLTPPAGTCFPLARLQPGSVRIEFTAGFGTVAEDGAVTGVPEDLVAALKLMVGAAHKDREAGGVPPAAQAVLDRYGCLAVA